jgi:hypothetical protein
MSPLSSNDASGQLREIRTVALRASGKSTDARNRFAVTCIGRTHLC